METNDILIQKLEKFIRKYYNNIAIKGSILFAAVLFFLFLTFSLFEYFAYSNTLIRSILFYTFILINVFVLIRLIAFPLLKKWGLLKRLSYEEAAKIIGEHFPQIDDKLLNAIQLNKQISEAQVQSMELLLASIEFKILQIKPFVFQNAIKFTQNLKYLKYAILPLLCIVFIFSWESSVFTEPAYRIIHHGKDFEKPAPYRFIVENEDLKAFQNENFVLQIKIEGEEVPEEAFIEINGHLHKLSPQSRILFHYEFKNLQQNTSFRLATDEVSSSYYDLKVLPKPLMINFSIALEYPSYLHKINETVDNSGDLTVPQGTKITWKFNTRNTEEVVLKIGETNYSLNKQSYIFSHSLRAMNDLLYTVVNKNQYITNSDSLQYYINVIPDAYPAIEVLSMNDSVFFDRFYFKGDISDDYGFKKLEFVYSILNKEDTVQKATTISIPIDLSLNRQDFYYYFDAQTLNLQLGQRLIYYFEIWDNDGINGSKSSRSLPMEFRLPTLDEIEKQSEQITSQTKSDMSKMLSESEKILKSIEDLKRKMIDQDKLSWQDKKQMEELLKELQNIKDQINHVSEEQKIQQQIESQHNLTIDEELLQKQEEIQKRFDELFSDEMKQMMDELQKMMNQNMDKNKFNEMLDKMQLSTEELNKQLDQNLELLKYLEYEKKMESTIDKMKQLSEKQKELSKETSKKESDINKLSEQQKDLNNEFEQLLDDVKELEKLNKSLEEPFKMAETKQLEREIKEKLTEAQTQLQKNKKQKSAESQEEAGEKMEQMADQMQQSYEDSQEESLDEDMRAVRQVLDNIVKTSFLQEELMLKLSQINTKDPLIRKIIQEQYAMKDHIQMIEDSITAIAKRQPAVEPFVLKQVASIKNAQKQILETINLTQDMVFRQYWENRTFNRSISRQQFVMTSLNELALMLSESLKNMQNKKQSGSKSGKKSCPNDNCTSDGGSKPKESGKDMQKMRKMQEQLNRQLEEMRKQMQNPGGKQQGSQSMSEQFARMAAQQEAIRKMVQEHQSQLKKEGKGYDGQLDRLMKEMEQTEKELVNKILNQQTIQRQHQIATRLLESERAEIKQGKDDKRESRQANEIQRNMPPELLELQKKQKQEIELYRTVSPALKHFYKNKVNQYFYKI